jgi:hypothetical protein
MPTGAGTAVLLQAHEEVVQRAELQAEDHRRLELLVQGLDASRQALTQQLQRQAQAGGSPQAVSTSSPRTPRSPAVPGPEAQSLQSMAGGRHACCVFRGCAAGAARVCMSP